MVQQGVPPGEQHHVHVGVPDEPGEHRGLVHARADGADGAFGAHPLQRRIRLGERLLLVVVRVVDEHDVDAVELEPFQAGLQAAVYAVGAEIPLAVVGGGQGGEAVCGVGAEGGLHVVDGVVGYEQAADLGAEGELLAGSGLQHGAEAAFRQAQAVVRGRVEAADALFPGRLDGGAGVLLGDGAVEPGEWRAAEREFCDGDAAAPEAVPPDVHGGCHPFSSQVVAAQRHLRAAHHRTQEHTARRLSAVSCRRGAG
jgi:hypothetical protein